VAVVAQNTVLLAWQAVQAVAVAVMWLRQEAQEHQDKETMEALVLIQHQKVVAVVAVQAQLVRLANQTEAVQAEMGLHQQLQAFLLLTLVVEEVQLVDLTWRLHSRLRREEQEVEVLEDIQRPLQTVL
jgi:hypothetical protein